MHYLLFNRRIRSWLAPGFFAGALLLTGVVPPAVAQDAQTSTPAGQNQAAKVVIESISVVGPGDRVFIKATGPVQYTSFKLKDPDRILVDITGAELGQVNSPIEVNNRFIADIKTFTVGDEEKTVRIIINVQKGVENFIKEGENSLVVALVQDTASDMKAEAAAPAVTNAAESLSNGSGAKAAEQKTEETAVKETLPPAKKIVKVESSQDNGTTTLTITADGAVDNYKSFALGAPSRVIVDIAGVTNQTGKSVFAVKNKQVKSVRIGAYKDKVRMVIDLTAKGSMPFVVTKAGSALVLKVGASVVPDKSTQSSQAATTPAAQPAVTPAVAAAPVTPPVAAAVTAPATTEGTATSAKQAESAVKAEPTAEKTEPATAVKPQETAAAAPKQAEPMVKEDKEAPQLTRVDFRIVGAKGRLTVAGSAKVPYEIKESEDGKTLVMDFKNAVIREDLVRTLDATKLGTAVVSISSYQESFKPSNVRVLVKLSEKTAYEVKEEDGRVSLDFAASAEAKKDSSVEATAAQYAGRKIDLDMIDASVADVLRLLAEVSNLNIIASDDVKGTISLRLKNVPWEQAFDIILKSKELDKVQEGNVVRVAPTSRLRQERETALAAKKAQDKLEDMQIRYVAINYATASDLEPQVKGVLSERGTVSSEKRTNTLIIKDVKDGLDKASDLIKKLDTQIPQVIIEARIVEAETTFARDLGIQWGVDARQTTNGTRSALNLFGSADKAFGQFAYDPAQDQSPTGNVSQITPAQANNAQKVLGWNGTLGVSNYMVNLPATGKAGPLGAIGMLLGKAGNNPLMLDLRLTAGETEGRVRTISRPRVTTMDNKEAKIEQGESIPFATTSSAGTATTFIEANLSLTVTPHITPDGSVIMKIKATRNAIGSFRTSSGAPSINKKEATTEVLVKDGETTVIGGIVISDKSETESGLPYLKDIPFIGVLFKSKSVSDSQTELLIFITPTIVKDKIVS